LALADVIDKVIDIVNNDVTLKGVYFGDQMSYSAYPVACVGVGEDFLLNENFPVIAQYAVHDEQYTIGIVIMVEFADTLANAKLIMSLTETMRNALRADMKPPLEPLGGYCYLSEMGKTKFLLGSKGEKPIRFSVTLVNYIKRMGP